MSIILQNIVKKFGKTIALAGVDLSVGPGIYGLLGPNGAGKTTLMRIITTLLPADEGESSILGLDPGRHSLEIRRRLGYLPQEFGLYKNLNAQESLEYIAALRGLKKPQARIASVLEQVALADRAKDKVGGYSGGMKRRLGIAQAILAEPDLLVVDEPTASLDPEERIRFRNLLVELATDRIILLSTHIVGDIEASCNELAVMNKGKIAFTGKVGELVSMAQGQVWEVVRSTAPAGCRIISTRRDGEDVVCRVLSAKQPGQGARSLPPTLEDGYMQLMEGGVDNG